MERYVLVMGVETSCDETAAAIVDDRGTILAQALATQTTEHEIYGGVVPEIAARAHLSYLPPLIKDILKQADLNLEQIDAFAATTGPGLVGGLLVGSMMTKAMAFALQKPFVAVNHLEAHALSARMVADVPFPYLLLLISGGHTQLLLAQDVGRYKLLGTTLDDALGEAFDKTAQMLGLGYPGGRQLEQQARAGDPLRFRLPRPLINQPGCSFSFSGLKTAVRQLIQAKLPELTAVHRPSLLDEQRQTICDVSAAFQSAVVDVVSNRCEHAIAWCREHAPDVRSFVMAGGVAANTSLRQAVQKLCTRNDVQMMVPPIELCTDNAAMVAWAGLEHFRMGQIDSYDAPVRPVWPLENLQDLGHAASKGISL